MSTGERRDWGGGGGSDDDDGCGSCVVLVRLSTSCLHCSLKRASSSDMGSSMDVMVVGGKSQNLLLPTTMAQAGVARVKDIREHAKSASLQAIQGASALSILASARSLADAGFDQERNGDLSGALYKYSQAAK